MSPDALARALMTEVLDSFEKLEVVVRLARHAPASLSPLATEAGLAEDRAAEALAGLVAAGVVARTGNQYRIADGRWSEHVRELAELYRVDRMEVVALMSTAALERMRDRAARAFADAFVIGARKKGDGDG
jgi:hypothetical protein